MVSPLLYVTLGACVALLLLSFALPLGSLWYAVARVLAVAGLLAIISSILLAVYMLFFMPVHPSELTRISVPGSALVNLPSARKYVLLRANFELPPDLIFEVRPTFGEGVSYVWASEHGWSYLHMNNRKVGGFAIPKPGVYEVTTRSSGKPLPAAVLLAPDYSGEFAAGKLMAALALAVGIALRLSARGVASVTSNKRHVERVAQGFQFFHEQKGLAPHRLSRARLKIYDRALVLTRKFSESEIGRAEVVAVEKAQKTIKSSKAGMPNTYLEGVRVHYQRGGSPRSFTFWTDSDKRQDLGRTDRILREKLREAGYPVR